MAAGWRHLALTTKVGDDNLDKQDLRQQFYLQTSADGDAWLLAKDGTLAVLVPEFCLRYLSHVANRWAPKTGGAMQSSCSSNLQAWEVTCLHQFVEIL